MPVSCIIHVSAYVQSPSIAWQPSVRPDGCSRLHAHTPLLQIKDTAARWDKRTDSGLKRPHDAPMVPGRSSGGGDGCPTINIDAPSSHRFTSPLAPLPASNIDGTLIESLLGH